MNAEAFGYLANKVAQGQHLQLRIDQQRRTIRLLESKAAHTIAIHLDGCSLCYVTKADHAEKMQSLAAELARDHLAQLEAEFAAL